jgi:hypothetical protein
VFQKKETQSKMAGHKQQEEWIRSDNFRADLIRVLEHGDFYDCTFQVTCSETGAEKVINLSTNKMQNHILCGDIQ